MPDRDEPPAPLPGVYPPGEPGPPGEAITIHHGPVRVGDGDDTDGRVWLRMGGHLGVHWQADAPFPLGPTTLTLDRPDLGSVTLDVVATHSEGGGYVNVADTGEVSNLDHVIAHWVNLPTLLPATPLTTNSNVYAGRWTCEASGWRVTLDQRLDHHATTQQMRDTDSFAVTHIGKLERSDGQPFSSTEAVDALAGWQAALSFARGSWVAPALPVGYTRDGSRAWEQWAPWRCRPYHGHLCWWDNHRSGDLAALCQEFMAAWADPGRRDAVRLGAYHAVCASSDDATIEARVMLAQAGLEYLAWVTYVLEGDRSKKEQGGREAHDVLRELLTDSGIPSDIPPDLAALATVFDAPDLDGPRAVTWLRNRLVHPKDAAEPYRIENALSQCWLLSVEYLELALLRRLGYNGRYLPRRSGGLAHASMPVPWATQETATD